MGMGPGSRSVTWNQVCHQSRSAWADRVRPLGQSPNSVTGMTAPSENLYLALLSQVSGKRRASAVQLLKLTLWVGGSPKHVRVTAGSWVLHHN